MTIGQLARAAGLGVETLRFYERKGLLDPPPRRASGYRQYPAEALDRLAFVRRAKGHGFTLDEIAEFIGFAREPAGTCGAVRERARARLLDLEERIATLESMRTNLTRLIATCERAAPDDACAFLTADGETL